MNTQNYRSSGARARWCLPWLLIVPAWGQEPTQQAADEAHSHHSGERVETETEADEEPMMDMMKDPIGISMSQQGSGTAWQPESTPVYGHHFMAGDLMLMLHYSVQAGYIYQSSLRGDQQFISTNWIMLMAQHPLFRGQLTGQAMLSAEPLTTGGRRGYPLLLQTGEDVGGAPLHDRQHPHDLFMSLAAKYSRALSRHLAWEIYLAPSGEPALGPVAFPHRLSSSSNPLAVLGHHWQDSTHISFGVVTAGIYTQRFKLEGSWFNGREPDENRYDFDFRALDSYSGRFSFNPNDELSLQLSYGYLKSPERLEPSLSVQRVTASVTWNKPLEAGNWATTAVFGHNNPSSGPSTSAVFLESNFEISSNTIFGRLEYIQRTGADLVLPAASEKTIVDAVVLECGYVRDFRLRSTVVGLGAVGSLNFINEQLRPVYNARVPFGGMIFLRLRPY